MKSVTLRPVRESDLDTLAAHRNPEEDPYNWFGYKPDGAMRRRLDDPDSIGERAGWLAVQAPDGTLAGDVSWYAVSYGPASASLALGVGISLLPGQRGRGYGAAAQRALARYLFATTLAERVEASTDVTNLAEQRSLTKAGFTREGVLRHAQFRAGGWHDMVLYSVLRGEVSQDDLSARSGTKRVHDR